MSFSFYVKAPLRPRYGDVVDDLPFPEVCCCEERDEIQARYEAEANSADEDADAGEEEYEEDEEEDEGFDHDAPWPDDPLHFYLPGISTRTIEAAWEDGTFQVRIMAFAAPEEYDLALAFVERVAELTGSDVKPEDGDKVPARRLREEYGEKWINGQLALFHMLPQMARQQAATLQMMGPVRPFHFGKRLLGELEDAGPPEELRERIIEAMRRAQYVDPEVYYAASALQLKKKEGGKEFTLAAWGPSVRYLFPDVQYLAVIEGENDHFMVPYEALPEIAGERCTFLDEVQTLVEAFDDYEWPELLERARQHEVDPMGDDV